MKGYKHMMEQLTLSEQAKEGIMEKLEHKQSAGRRISLIVKAALAAALIMGCIGVVAVANQEVVEDFDPIVTIVGLPDGAEFYIEQEPIVLEDGRLWFIEGDRRTDITDLVDESTPCCRAVVNPETGGVTDLLVVGGTPENFGWAVFHRTGGGCASTGMDYYTSHIVVDGVDYDVTNGLPNGYPESYFWGMPYYRVWAPWIITAAEQLDIGWIN